MVLCEVMWDGIDCHRCRIIGWIACSWDEPELRFVHLRLRFQSTGIFTGRIRHGYGQYFMGTGLFLLPRARFYESITSLIYWEACDLVGMD